MMEGARYECQGSFSCSWHCMLKEKGQGMSTKRDWGHFCLSVEEGHAVKERKQQEQGVKGISFSFYLNMFEQTEGVVATGTAQERTINGEGLPGVLPHGAGGSKFYTHMHINKVKGAKGRGRERCSVRQ